MGPENGFDNVFDTMSRSSFVKHSYITQPHLTAFRMSHGPSLPGRIVEKPLRRPKVGPLRSKLLTRRQRLCRRCVRDRVAGPPARPGATVRYRVWVGPLNFLNRA